MSTSGNVGPFGGAIRNWGPLDEVFIAPEMHEEGVDDVQWSELHYYTCSDNDDCASSTFEGSDDLTGEVEGANHPHPALAVKRANSSSPVHVLGIGREVVSTCDASPGDDNADLVAYEWNTSAGIVDSWLAKGAQGGDCDNVGIPRARYLDGYPWSCYTFRPEGDVDHLGCNFADSSSSTTFGHHFMMANSGTDEDHPSFAFYGSNDDLAVAGIKRQADDEVRVHFPDIPTSFPAEVTADKAVFSGPGGSDVIDHVDLEESGGWLYAVWVENTGTNAKIVLNRCDTTSDDCSVAGNWAGPQVVADSTTGYHYDAQMTQIVLDGDRQFVTWQYDATGSNRWRVMVASRCGTGSWTREQVRTAAGNDYDQLIAVGRPSLVLNRNERIAHIVLNEGVGSYPGKWNTNGLGASTLYWYRTGYDECI